MHMQSNASPYRLFPVYGPPQAEKLLWTRSLQETALQLVRTYGYNSTSYFALGVEKKLFLSSANNCLMSYAVQGRSLLALGDPIGPETFFPQALQEFLAFCRRQRKGVAFWQAREELLPLYREQGLHAFKIGEDAILDVQSFTLKGNRMANVRSSTRRAEKDGLQVIFFYGKGPNNQVREQMRDISQNWLTSKGGDEMGFSMGHFEDAENHAQFLACAMDGQQNMHAFVSFVPIYGRNGWALDLLRRKHDATPGTMEFLLVHSLEYLKALNVEVVSLGLAPLHNGNQDRLSCWNRWGQALLGYSKAIAQYQSLNFFKQKFHPHWENRYFLFTQRTHLLQTALDLRQIHYAQQER